MTALIVLLIVTAAYLFCICPSLRKHPFAHYFRETLFAHRGLFDNRSEAPENSMKAFAKAVEGGWGIETDIQLSKDGVAVLHHDFALKRTMRDEKNQPVKGKVSDYTYAELQHFHILDSAERIPTLEAFLKLVDGKVPLILEYKIEESDRDLQVCQTAEKLLRTYRGPYCVESFNPRGVLWYKKNRPDIMRGQLSDAFYHNPNCTMIHFLCAMLCFNFLTRPDFIAYNIKAEGNLSRKLCHGLYRNTAAAWTVRNEQQLAFARKHFDGIIFDSFVPGKSSV
jgi:glycerophosphoryl diester phosphodiesterase